MLHQKVYWWRHKFQFFKQKILLLFVAKETWKIETSFYEKDAWNLSESKTQVAFTYSKVNNRNTRKMCEICSKLTIKIPERRQWRRSGIFNFNFKHISHLALVILLLTLNMQLPAGKNRINEQP